MKLIFYDSRHLRSNLWFIHDKGENLITKNFNAGMITVYREYAYTIFIREDSITFRNNTRMKL